MTDEELLERLKQNGNNMRIWKYNHIEKKLNSRVPMNYFDVIVTYNPEERWLLIHELRYGIECDPKLPDIIDLEKSYFCKDLLHLDKYFCMDNPFDKIIYELLMECLFGCTEGGSK